jgi:hypothetical protein
MWPLFHPTPKNPGSGASGSFGVCIIGDRRAACTAIVNGAGRVACTSATDSRAASGFTCNSGFYIVKAAPSTNVPDRCQGMLAICHAHWKSRANQYAGVESGIHLDPLLPACTMIANGSGRVTCTSASNSRAGTGFICNSGFYLVKSTSLPTPDRCQSKLPVFQLDSQSNPGFTDWSLSAVTIVRFGIKACFLAGCTPIGSGSGPVTCTGATNSRAARGFACKAGYYLSKATSANAADRCAGVFVSLLLALSVFLSSHALGTVDGRCQFRWPVVCLKNSIVLLKTTG